MEIISTVCKYESMKKAMHIYIYILYIYIYVYIKNMLTLMFFFYKTTFLYRE